MREESWRWARTGLLVVGVAGALSLAWPGSAAAQSHTVAMPILASSVHPKEFGVQDETRTVISAAAFYPGSDNSLFGGIRYDTSANLGRFCADCTAQYGEFFATLSLPAGAVIDFIGLNSANDTAAVFGVALWQRDRYSNMGLLYGFSVPAHDWDTDFAGPLGIQVTDHIDKELVLNVEQATSPNTQYFGWVEVWWHRTVSPPPAAASFNDVPTSHPFFQFIEALKASGVTGGCGGGNYCPDSPLTRGQMAVFLAKALGLHWPN